MGVSAMTAGLIAGGLGAGTSLLNSALSANQATINSRAQQANASAMRQQAFAMAKAGQMEAENLDKERSRMRAQYEKLQGANRVTLGVGNVDASSGSALAIADANANAYAADLGDNAYSRALKLWETKTAVQNTLAQANNMSTIASYQRRAANNLLPTLLGAGLAGGTMFIGGYKEFGGELKNLFK